METRSRVCVYLSVNVQSSVLHRYSSNWIQNYRGDLCSFFEGLKGALPEETLVIWNLTMPLGEKVKGGFLVPEVSGHVSLTFPMPLYSSAPPQSEHRTPQLRQDVIEANFYSGTLADAYQMDVLDLHFLFRFSLQHRTEDGVHWNAVAHRGITSLLSRHAAEAWGVVLPCPGTAVGEDVGLLTHTHRLPTSPVFCV